MEQTKDPTVRIKQSEYRYLIEQNERLNLLIDMILQGAELSLDGKTMLFNGMRTREALMLIADYKVLDRLEDLKNEYEEGSNEN